MRIDPSRRHPCAGALGVFLCTVTLGCGGHVAEGRDTIRADAASASASSDDASAAQGDATSAEDASRTTEGDDASGRVLVNINYTPPSFTGVDCGPRAPADPVSVSVNVVFDTPPGEGPQAVTFPAGRVKFTRGSQSLTWNFAVMTAPVDPSPPPPKVVESLWNLPGSGAGTGAPCDYCAGNAEFDLEVSSPGQSPYWTAAVSQVQCTYN